jgi:hypothetical protein
MSDTAPRAAVAAPAFASQRDQPATAADLFYPAFNAHDFDWMASLCTSDVSWKHPYLPGGIVRGLDAFMEVQHSMHRALPDVQIESHGGWISADRQFAFGVWTFAGTFVNPLDPPGWAPTNTRLENYGATLAELRDGLLCRMEDFTNVIPTARQIGALPREGGIGEAMGMAVQRLAAAWSRRRNPLPTILRNS